MSNNEKRFLVDAMLGNLAKKLRLLGFDSEYQKEKSDEELIKIVQDQNRILITKDEELANKVKKLGFEPIFLTGDEELLHFKEIKRKLNLGNFSINANNSRCTLCNGELNPIEKNQIKEQIPKNVLEIEKNFWQCISCKKIYWEGTHITNLQNFVGRLND